MNKTRKTRIIDTVQNTDKKKCTIQKSDSDDDEIDVLPIAPKEINIEVPPIKPVESITPVDIPIPAKKKINLSDDEKQRRSERLAEARNKKSAEAQYNKQLEQELMKQTEQRTMSEMLARLEKLEKKHKRKVVTKLMEDKVKIK